MSTIITAYIAKIALGLMLYPLYKEYKKRQVRKTRVREWRKRYFNKNCPAQSSLNF